MSDTPLPPGVYGYHDVSVGDFIELGPMTISADLVDQFAAVSGDRYELHMDDHYAVGHGFDRRVAHGLLILSVVDGMKNNAPAKLGGLVSLGWNWWFRSPVLVEDTIHARLEIADKRLTSSGRRGILGLNFSVFNQHDFLVQNGSNELLFEL